MGGYGERREPEKGQIVKEGMELSSYRGEKVVNLAREGKRNRRESPYEYNIAWICPSTDLYVRIRAGQRESTGMAQVILQATQTGWELAGAASMNT